MKGREGKTVSFRFPCACFWVWIVSGFRFCFRFRNCAKDIYADSPLWSVRSSFAVLRERGEREREYDDAVREGKPQTSEPLTLGLVGFPLAVGVRAEHTLVLH